MMPNACLLVQLNRQKGMSILTATGAPWHITSVSISTTASVSSLALMGASSSA
jgi:hypothetical protein